MRRMMLGSSMLLEYSHLPWCGSARTQPSRLPRNRVVDGSYGSEASPTRASPTQKMSVLLLQRLLGKVAMCVRNRFAHDCLDHFCYDAAFLSAGARSSVTSTTRCFRTVTAILSGVMSQPELTR